jgi:diguanylate cyclase (GGDEF)-like protein
MGKLRAIGRRDALILLAMWGVGALLLVSVIGFSGRADNARKRQLVVETMREDAAGSPGITWNSADISGDAAHGRVDRIAQSFRSSITRLRALGDERYSVPIGAAAGNAVATDEMIAGLVAIDRISLALEVTSLSFRPGGSAFALRRQLDRAAASYRSQATRADREASAASIALTVVLLIAFSCALYRSMSARKRAEALSIDKQLLLEQSQSDAATDALTGMANRRKLFDDTDRLLASLGEGSSVSLGIFDLDGFKNYNDSFGHPAGDALLAHLGHRLSGAMAGRGTAYRLGGDEFCVVTSEPDAESVLAAAAAALTERGERFSITCSYGVATIPVEASRLEQALQIADRRLYGSKELTRSTQSVQIKDALMQVLAEQGVDLVPHLSRVALLAGETGACLGLSVDEIARIRLAAELHDIGKAAVPGVILEKPGPLDAAELAYLRQHSLIGERILSAAPALENVAPLVRATHERPDGTGYPDGLRLEQIPMGARVIAVVDAFDAMTTMRPYQRIRTVDQACVELRRGAGTQFDSVVVDAFIAVVNARDRNTWHRLPTQDDEHVRPLLRVPASDARRRAGSGRRARRG